MPPLSRRHSSLSPRDAAPASGTRLTARGAGLLGLSALLIVTGIVLPEAAAIHLGLFGVALVLISRPLAKRNLNGLTLTREAPPFAFAGQLFPLKLILRNEGKMDRFSVDVEDGVAGPAERGLHARRLRAGGTATREFHTRMLRRGVSHRVRAVLSSGFPLGLWRTTREIRDRFSMTIFPRPVTPRELEEAQDAALLDVDEAESVRRDWTGDFHGVRPFQPGDRLKLIHWPGTARAGQLMVRQFDRRLPEKYTIIFHSVHPGRRAGEAARDGFESALELLSGLLLHCRERAIPSEIIASFNEWRPFPAPHPAAPEEALAMLAAARHAPENSPAGLLQALAPLQAGARVFVLSDVPVREWEHLLPETPFTVTCLSVRELRVKRPLFRARTFAEAKALVTPPPPDPA